MTLTSINAVNAKGDKTNMSLTKTSKSIKPPIPTAAQLAWQKAEIGIVFHYDLHVFDDKEYRQGENRRKAFPDPNIFNPTKLDTDQWIKTAKSIGAKFAILTASHETGFRLWQSDVTPDYSLKAVKWGDGKRDLVKEFIASCKKYGLKPGIYMGTRWNSHLQFLDFRPTKNSKITLAEYNRRIEAEVEEICSRYGDLFEIWFDGGAYGPKDGGPDVLKIFEKYQKTCVFYHNYQRADVRWGGSESGTVPYPCWGRLPFKDGYAAHDDVVGLRGKYMLKHGDPNGDFWCPAMSDAPLRNHEWFWDEGDDRKVRTVDNVVNMIFNSTGHNSTLILGLAPDNRGLIPDVDVEVCKKVGLEMKRLFANPLAHTAGKGISLELNLDTEVSVDQIVLQEDVSKGERVREFVLEGLSDGKWTAIFNGTCIGHKLILRKLNVKASKLRIVVSKSVDEPIISNFTAYDTKSKSR